MDNKFCIECGFELPITAKFCERCGNEIIQDNSSSNTKRDGIPKTTIKMK